MAELPRDQNWNPEGCESYKAETLIKAAREKHASPDQADQKKHKMSPPHLPRQFQPHNEHQIGKGKKTTKQPASRERGKQGRNARPRSAAGQHGRGEAHRN
jgi:hypothetical protein